MRILTLLDNRVTYSVFAAAVFSRDARRLSLCVSHRCNISRPSPGYLRIFFILSFFFTAAYKVPRVNFIAALVNVQEDDACEKAFTEAYDVFEKYMEEHYADPAIADKLAAFIKASYEFIKAVAADYPDMATALKAVEAACVAPETAYLRGSI